MKRDFYTTAARADALLANLRHHIEPRRWIWTEQRGIRLPYWGGQQPVDTTPPVADPNTESVFIWQRSERFGFCNHWGFELEARLWPQDVMTRKRVFTAAVLVHLSEDIILPEHIAMTFWPETQISLRPEPHERAAFEVITEHNRQLVRALRAQGFRRRAKTYTPPRIERYLGQDRQGSTEGGFVWSDSSWTWEANRVEAVVEVISALMDCKLSTALLPGKNTL